MLQPDKTYTFLWDQESRRPACVLLQALLGGDREPCFVFPEWQVNMARFVAVKATGAEIERFATGLQRT